VENRGETTHPENTRVRARVRLWIWGKYKKVVVSPKPATDTKSQIWGFIF
jgi:hypothetical protein